jgi:hypothetical protein
MATMIPSDIGEFGTEGEHIFNFKLQIANCKLKIENRIGKISRKLFFDK